MIVYFIFFPLFSMVYYSKSFIMSLLLLESMILVLVLSFSMMIMSQMIIFFLLLVLGVCEGALGLSVLVSMLRGCGNDNLNMMSLYSC